MIVAVGGKDLRFPSRNGRVARNHRGRHATRGLDRERQRRHVEKEHVLHVAFEDAALNGRANGDNLIRVHPFVRFLADEITRNLNDLGHACHPSYEHELVNFLLRNFGVSQACLYWWNGPLEQIIAKLLELGARQSLLNMLRSTRVRRNERQIDFVFLSG